MELREQELSIVRACRMYDRAVKGPSFLTKVWNAFVELAAKVLLF